MGSYGGLRRLCLGMACLQRWAALGQIIELESYPAPTPGSLMVAYVFSAYGLDEASHRSEGVPHLSLDGLSADGADYSSAREGGVRPDGYGGVQVTVLRDVGVATLARNWVGLGQITVPRDVAILNFGTGWGCSTQADVDYMRSNDTEMLLLERSELLDNSTEQVFQQSVPFGGKTASNLSWVIERTGIYMLLISNCGSITSATINGTVTVKNAYGYLPGNEYPKMPFYSWLTLAYAGLAIIWVMVSVRYWDQVFRIQICILVVLLLGFGESLLWSVFLRAWNLEGQSTTHGTMNLAVALLFTVLKSTFSYMLVLVACLGWGVTKPSLSGGTLCKVGSIGVLHVGFAFAREVLLSFRHSYSIPAELVLTVFAPVAVLITVMFGWIFRAIGRLMETLKEDKQTEKFQIFRTLFAVLIAAISGAALTLLVEVYNLSKPPHAVWKHQWILTDAVSHLLFLLVLVVIMYLWRPHPESQRYAFSAQVSNVDMDGDARARSVANGDLRKLEGAEVYGQTCMDKDLERPPPPDVLTIEDEEQAPQGRPGDQEQAQRNDV